MPWRGPTYTGEFPSLGWDVIAWAETHFSVPDGPLAGEPLRLTDEQAAIVVRFYGLDDRGRWLVRRAAVRRAQGWGKSPLLGVIALAELCGPSRFGGWDADGEPIGVAPVAPWVQVAAVSEDQTDNTYASLYAMANESDLAGTVLDVGLTRIFLKNDTGRLEPVTAAAGSRLGQRVTFAVMDETHLWTPRNGGTKLAGTIRRNAGKMGGRTFESTNAHLPGEDSVAERTYLASEKGSPGLLYDSVEAPPLPDLTDRPAVVAGLRLAYGDAKWIDVERLADEIADPGTDPVDARRFYLNQLVAAQDQAIDAVRWADLADPDRVVSPTEPIALGFDGSIYNDSTVLYGCTRDRHIFRLGVWARPDGAKDWEVPRSEVRARMTEVFATLNVGILFADPPKWWTEIDEWATEFGPERVVKFDTNKDGRFAPACDRLMTGTREGSLSHDGDPVLAAHVAATARKKVRVRDEAGDGRTQYVFTKLDTRKIDATVAAALALEASVLLPEAVDVAANVW